jgi:hypothetical protein
MHTPRDANGHPLVRRAFLDRVAAHAATVDLDAIRAHLAAGRVDEALKAASTR